MGLDLKPILTYSSIKLSDLSNKIIAVFTIGLMFFTVMLMLHNLIAVYAYLAMAPLYPNDLLPYFVAIHIAELVGIVSLLRVTL